MSPCSLLPCKVVTALPPPCVCRVCLVRVLCGPARRGRVFPETAGAHAVVAEGAQGPRDQGQGGGRPGGHLGHPGGTRGSGAATGSHARGQAEELGGRGTQAQHGPVRTHLGGRPGEAEPGDLGGLGHLCQARA